MFDLTAHLTPDLAWRKAGGAGAVTPAFQADFTGLTSLPSWLSLSRASNAMVTDSTGKLTYAPNNLLTHSDDLTNATYWTASNVTVSSGIADPLGGTGAFTVTAGAINAQIFQSLSKTGNFVSSYWVRRRTGSGTVNAQTPDGNTNVPMSLTGSWQQFSTNSSDGSGAIYSLIQITTSGDAIDVYLPVLAQVTYETTPRTQDQVLTGAAAYYGPRFDHAWNGSAWVATGLMDEEQRTNLHKSSGDLTSADWGPFGLTSRSLSATLSPNGISFMTEILVASGSRASGSGIYNTSALSYTANTVVTVSRFIKKSNYNYASLSLQSDTSNAWVTAIFDLSTGLMTQSAQGSGSGTFVSATLKDVGGGIYRATLTASHAGSTAYGVIGVAQAATGNTFDNFGNVTLTSMAGTEKLLVWGAQFETGTFATSYIPTTTAAVTRSADIVQLTGAALTALQTSDWTLVAELTDTQPAFYQGYISAFGAGGANASPILSQNANATNQVRSQDSDASGINLVATLGSGSTAGPVRAALGRSAAGRSLASNGGTVVTDTNPTTITFTQINIAAGELGNNPINGHFRSIAIYSSRLSDTDLQAKSVVGAAF